LGCETGVHFEHETQTRMRHVRDLSSSRLPTQCKRYFQGYREDRYEYFLYIAAKAIPVDYLRGLAVRVSGYRSRGPCSILGATTFSEK
jgi:hypothetical protein